MVQRRRGLFVRQGQAEPGADRDGLCERGRQRHPRQRRLVNGRGRLGALRRCLARGACARAPTHAGGGLIAVAAVKETVEQVADAGALQARLRHRHRPGVRAQGADRRHRPLHLGPEGRAASGCWNGAWAPSSAGWRWKSPTGRGSTIPPIDYQDAYYYAAPKKKVGPEVAGRGRSGAAGDLRQARHPLEGAGSPGRRRGRAEVRRRRGVRQRLGGHHLQEGAGRGRA